MNKIILTLVCVGAIGLGAQPAAAQMMISRTLTTDNTQTAEEEAAGKNLWQQLQTEAVVCANLTDDDFDSLGEYFMGLMMGNSHAAMNLMMRQMMGDDGETQMHVVMGKRFTSCDPSAVVPATATGFTPMMQMMWGGYNYSNGYSNSMMGSWGYGVMGWGLMILWWVLTIVAIMALVKWLMNQSRHSKK